MITELYEAIITGLGAIRQCQIYIEDMPENFVRPSFLVSLAGQKVAKGINGRYKNTVNVDISYYPESHTEGYGECWGTGQELTRDFSIEGFRIRNRNLKPVDQVLHFTFDVDYRVCQEQDSGRMQSLAQNTDLKEE